MDMVLIEKDCKTLDEEMQRRLNIDFRRISKVRGARALGQRYVRRRGGERGANGEGTEAKSRHPQKCQSILQLHFKLEFKTQAFVYDSQGSLHAIELSPTGARTQKIPSLLQGA